MIALILQIVSAQGCTTLPSGLVSWWPGDGNPEDIIDSNLGYLTNGAAPTGNGEVSQAFNFDGIDDYFAVPNNSNLNIAQSWFFDAWVYPRAYPAAGNNAIIFMKWVDGAENKSFVIDSGGYASVILVGSGDYALATSTTALPINQWSNVSATYDGSNVCVFVNGGNKVCDPFSLDVLDSGGVLYFGYNPSRGGVYLPLNGMTDEMVWGTSVPTDEEILAIYNAGTSGMCAGTCGNDSIEWTEECDDGDTTSGDGCSSSCTVERTYTCSGEPSVCSASACMDSPSDMVSLWTGDNTTDDVKGVQNAILQGGATYDVGKVAQAFSIGPGGSGSYIKVPDNNALDLTDNGTLEAWIKLDTLPATASAYAIITKGDWDTANSLYYMLLIYHPSGSTYNLRLDLGNGSSYQTLQYAVTFNTDTWYHVAATWDTSTKALYFNGQLLDSSATNVYMPVANNYDVLIGADGPSSAPGYFFDGLIDEASIFNRALTQPEIQEIYDTDAGGICTAECGNGVIEGSEACDDGNTTPGDGCSAICTNESGVVTTTTVPNSPPSVGDPTDNGSNGTTPTNAGSDVTFTTTAVDPNVNDYYLAICK
ncbi:DUF4215 domain-containing protein, partial [Patescibacteria group bacterium]|nr:DUF4215 domain-containing protein [Patescibacteria group bacterium]